MTAYLGIDGTARKIAGGYVGIDGVARKITKAYVGVNGVAQLWWVAGGGDIVLEAKKISSSTYAGETSYSSEKFILLDIYPATNGTVSITYGGLTKTVTDTSGAAEPNAQQVFFGTFNGASDSVETPENGTLTIKGDCRGFGCGTYAQSSSKTSQTCNCVTEIKGLGNIVTIPVSAFKNCTLTGTVAIPDGVTSIGEGAFYRCTKIEKMTIPASVTSIHKDVFYYSGEYWSGSFLSVDEGNPVYSYKGCCMIEKATSRVVFGFADSVIPGGVKIIGSRSFYGVGGMSDNFVIPEGVKTIEDRVFYDADGITDLVIPSSVTNIGEGAFYSIDTLLRVRVLATTPPTAPDTSSSTFMFTNTSASNLVSITVPKGCGSAYKAAPQWSNFADKIVEAS